LIKILQRLIRERVSFWRQCCKFKYAIEGDENTKFFHALASHRYRKNKIHALHINGTDFTSHEHKIDTLIAYYKQLLGQTFLPIWNFNLANLYQQHAPGLSSLIQPFSENEITDAFFQMNSFASPGPDGFGPCLYKKYWQLVKQGIFNLFIQFHNQSAAV
jgi:hypothetical protein